MKMSQRAMLRVGILAGLVFSDSSAQEQPLFRASTNLVHLNVEIRDANSKIIAGLQQNDFEVFENGQKQTIALFLSEEQPLDLLFLLDISSSMSRRIREVAAASREGLKVLRTGDRVWIVTFNTEVHVDLWPTTDLSLVERGMRRAAGRSFRGGTKIQAAVVTAAQLMRKREWQEQGRRAILIITDNLGVPTRQEKAAINELREADASLNGLVVVPSRGNIGGLLAAGGVTLHGGIDQMVDKTGGDQMKLDNAEIDLPRTIQRIRTKYSFYYRVPERNVDASRENRVQLTEGARKRYPDARVVVRQAYVMHARDGDGFNVR